MSPELITFLTSMVPVIELRGAIPVAIEVFDIPPLKALIIAVIGNIIPNFFILAFLEPVSNFLIRHSTFFKKFFERLFHKTRNKHSQKFHRYGALFLVIFVAIPLPGSGSWTGSLIAFLFGVSYWKAMALVSTGVLCAGIIVTASVVGISGLFEKIFV